MGVGVGLVHEMHVVGGYYLDSEFVGHAQKLGVHFLLHRVGFLVGVGGGGLVALQFQVVVVAEGFFPPFYRFFGSLDVSTRYQFRNLSAKAGRAYDDALAVGSDFVLVGTRMRIEAVGPRLRHYFHEVMVAAFVLGQKNQVSACVVLVGMHVERCVCHVDLTSEYRFQYFFLQLGRFGPLGLGCSCVALLGGFGGCFLGVFYRSFGFAVLLVYVVEKLLYAEHVAVVGDGKRRHAVGNGLVDQRLD